METPLTTQEHLVPLDRTRITLREVLKGGVLGGSRVRCWVYGSLSQSLGKRVKAKGDHILLLGPKVLRFKPKPKEVVPVDLSPWIIHCGSQFQPQTRLLLVQKQEVVIRVCYE